MKDSGDETPEAIADLYSKSREVGSSKDLDDASPGRADPGDALDVPGLKFLTSLLTATPFTDYLHYKAVCVHTHKTRQGRITRYCDEHPRIAKFCTVSDLILRLIVVLMVLAAIAAILAGTIYRTFYAASR